MRRSNSHPLADALLSGTEVLVDVLTDDKVVSSIPIVGTALKACVALDTVRDRIFATKLLAFLRTVDAVPRSFRERLTKTLSDNPDESNRIGTTLLLGIERATDFSKPRLLALFFLSFIDRVVTADDLRRLTHAVDLTFADDLEFLISAAQEFQITDKFEATEKFAGLVAGGFVRSVAGQTYDDMGNLYLQPTPLLRTFLQAYTHGKAVSEGLPSPVTGRETDV